MVEGEEEGCRTHRLADGFCAIALQSRVRMYPCSSLAEDLRNLEQQVVVVVRRRMNLEQFDKRLSSHVASVRLPPPEHGEQSKSSLHQPIGLSHIQELERNISQGCQESSCLFSDDW